ncbi:NAD(P)-binding protein [Aspergillus leporis]|uniref:NAD(P)-binding protein n=1 Tax=Aspergillus leporis TaxID=41062 RepID=A0A5N5WHE8_9EURO|nr:NAD(P)-binding protein [Aspergillus leporis]
MSTPQKVFITGATGYIGRVVTELAVAKGHTVRGLSRREEGDALLRNLGATPVRGTLTDSDIIAREAKEADIIFHLAFDHDWSKPYEEILKLEYGAIDALAGALIGTDKPLVTSSGTAVVAPDPNGGETDETSPLPEVPVIPRHLAEEYALAYAKKGVRVTAVRLPQYVYGRATSHGFAADLIKMAAKSGESLYIGDGMHCCSGVYVDDAARLYFLVAKAGPGEIFNGTGSCDITYKGMASAIGKTLDVPVRGVTFEEARDRWGPFLSSFVSLHNRASNRKAVEVLGWKPVGPGLLEELESGSYVTVAERFKRELESGNL